MKHCMYMEMNISFLYIEKYNRVSLLSTMQYRVMSVSGRSRSYTLILHAHTWYGYICPPTRTWYGYICPPTRTWYGYTLGTL